MLFSFSFEPKANGLPLTTIEDCAAIIAEDPYNPAEWTVTDVVIDGVLIPLDHYLREPMIEAVCGMVAAIDEAWARREMEAA